MNIKIHCNDTSFNISAHVLSPHGKQYPTVHCNCWTL